MRNTGNEKYDDILRHHDLAAQQQLLLKFTFQLILGINKQFYPRNIFLFLFVVQVVLTFSTYEMAQFIKWS